MAYEESYARYSAENVFTGMINESGDIYNAGYRGATSKVGIDNERENMLLKQISEMQEVIDNYFNKLVELGEIVPQKTPEEIAAEQLRLAQEQAEQQASINKQLLEAIGALNAEVKELKGVTENGMDRKSTGLGRNTVRSDSENDGKKPTSNKIRNTTRKKNDSESDEQP